MHKTYRFHSMLLHFTLRAFTGHQNRKQSLLYLKIWLANTFVQSEQRLPSSSYDECIRINPLRHGVYNCTIVVIPTWTAQPAFAFPALRREMRMLAVWFKWCSRTPTERLKNTYLTRQMLGASSRCSWFYVFYLVKTFNKAKLKLLQKSYRSQYVCVFYCSKGYRSQ